MDFATIIGLVAGLGLMIFGIVTGDDGFAALTNFLHAQSALITFGGAFGATLVSNSLGDFVNGIKGIKMALRQTKHDQTEVIKKIIELSNVARKEGLLALEDAASDLDDAFMKKGIFLIVDGTEPDLVRAILETELTCIEDRHKKVSSFWETAAAMGPAWGMIGTLVGLINMLADLNDMASVGPNMAVALVTTLYGSLIANWLCVPIANKLKLINNNEYQMKEIIIEGLLSIQAGENPRVIEEKLKSFLSPDARGNVSDSEAGGEA